MKKTLMFIFVLFVSVGINAQQVLSSAALQSQRHSSSSSLSSSGFSFSGVSSSTPRSIGLSMSSSPSVSSSASSFSYSGSRLASTIYAPGATSVGGSPISRRRIGGDDDDDDDIPGVTPGDPGQQSQNFPIGNEMVLLLIAAAWLIIKIAKRKNKILKI